MMQLHRYQQTRIDENNNNNKEFNTTTSSMTTTRKPMDPSPTPAPKPRMQMSDLMMGPNKNMLMPPLKAGGGNSNNNYSNGVGGGRSGGGMIPSTNNTSSDAATGIAVGGGGIMTTTTAASPPTKEEDITKDDLQAMKDMIGDIKKDPSLLYRLSSLPAGNVEEPPQQQAPIVNNNNADTFALVPTATGHLRGRTSSGGGGSGKIFVDDDATDVSSLGMMSSSEYNYGQSFGDHNNIPNSGRGGMGGMMYNPASPNLGYQSSGSFGQAQGTAVSVRRTNHDAEIALRMQSLRAKRMMTNPPQSSRMSHSSPIKHSSPGTGSSTGGGALVPMATAGSSAMVPSLPNTQGVTSFGGVPKSKPAQIRQRANTAPSMNSPGGLGGAGAMGNFHGNERYSDPAPPPPMKKLAEMQDTNGRSSTERKIRKKIEGGRPRSSSKSAANKQDYVRDDGGGTANENNDGGHNDDQSEDSENSVALVLYEGENNETKSNNNMPSSAVQAESSHAEDKGVLMVSQDDQGGYNNYQFSQQQHSQRQEQEQMNQQQQQQMAMSATSLVLTAPTTTGAAQYYTGISKYSVDEPPRGGSSSRGDGRSQGEDAHQQRSSSRSSSSGTNASRQRSKLAKREYRRERRISEQSESSERTEHTKSSRASASTRGSRGSNGSKVRSRSELPRQRDHKDRMRSSSEQPNHHHNISSRSPSSQRPPQPHRQQSMRRRNKQRSDVAPADSSQKQLPPMKSAAPMDRESLINSLRAEQQSSMREINQRADEPERNQVNEIGAVPMPQDKRKASRRSSDQIRNSLNSYRPKGKSSRRHSAETQEQKPMTAQEGEETMPPENLSKEEADRVGSLTTATSANSSNRSLGVVKQEQQQRQPPPRTNSLEHDSLGQGLAKLGGTSQSRRRPSMESESGKSVISRLSHLRRKNRTPSKRSVSSSDVGLGVMGTNSSHLGSHHSAFSSENGLHQIINDESKLNGSDSDPPGHSHTKEQQLKDQHPAKSSSFHGSLVSRISHIGHHHHRRPTSENHLPDHMSATASSTAGDPSKPHHPYIANDESDHVTLGIEMAIRSGQVPRLCDERGRCLFHPHIRLQKPKIFGGWKVLFQHCPDCAVEHMKKTQEELTIMQLQKEERKLEREREKRLKEEEQERRRQERKLEKKKRRSQKEPEKEKGEDPVIGKNVGDEDFALAEHQRKNAKKKSSSQRKKERERRKEKEKEQQLQHEYPEQSLVPVEAEAGAVEPAAEENYSLEKSGKTFYDDSEDNNGYKNDDDDQEKKEPQLNLSASNREYSEVEQQEQQNQGNTDQQRQEQQNQGNTDQQRQEQQSTEQPLDQSSSSLAIVPHKPKNPKSKKVNGLPWSDYNGHSGRYTGEVNEQYLPHGKGEMVYDRGVISAGIWYNGVLDTEEVGSGNGSSMMVVSQEAYTPDTLPRYCVGDKGKEEDMVIDSKKATAAAVAEIRANDAAFVRRSDGSWTYAIVKDRTYGGDNPTIRFKVNVRGSTKAFPTSQWGTYVRRIKKREDPIAPKEGGTGSRQPKTLGDLLDGNNKARISGASSLAGIRRLDSDNMSVGSAHSAPLNRSVDNLTTAKMKIRTRSRSRSRNRKNVTTLPLLFSSSMSVSEENEGHDNDDWETASGSGYRLRGIDP